MLVILTVCLLSLVPLCSFFVCIPMSKPIPNQQDHGLTTTNKSYTQLSLKLKKKEPKPVLKSSKHIYMCCTSKPIFTSTPKSHCLNSNSQARNQKYPVPHFTNPNLNYLNHFNQQKNQSLNQLNQKQITKPNTKGGSAINKMRK